MRTVGCIAQGGAGGGSELLTDTTRAWFDVAGHQPLWQAVLVVLGTFVLEDAATVLTAMAVQQGQMGAGTALAALYAGIVLGDAGLYGLGHLAGRVPWARRWSPPPGLRAGGEWVREHLVRTVFASRFLPGARLPTYTACGFVGADFRVFVLSAIGATLVWTSLLFGLALMAGRVLIDHLGVWRGVGMAGTALAVVLVGYLAAQARTQ